MVLKKYTNGDEYDGDWEDGKKNGQGTLTYANGGSYEGEWTDNMRDGYGVNKWANGDHYSGNWKDNKRNGKGKYVYADGGKYVGQWRNDMRHGHGENTWSNGNHYEGHWEDNEQHGHGTFTYKDGGKYIGNWEQNMRDGQGVNTWANGDRYEGLWKYNQKHGQGTLQHADGKKETGVWVNDELNGTGVARKNNVKTGNGKNALQFKSFWVNGQPFIILLMPKSAGCPYLALAREYMNSLNWPKSFFNDTHNRCYCTRCYKEAWKDVIEAGEGRYVIPRGWVRIGLTIDPVVAKTQDIWNKWIVTFHGTSTIAAQSILTHRQFCHPGDVLIDGTKLRIRPGHIPNQLFVYTSPTIAYSSGPAYSPVYPFHSTENDANYEVQIVLQCRQMPDSFKIGPETIGADKTQICKHIPNSEIEYFTDRRGTIHAYGLLVRFRPKNN
jgi:hypothetical protein